MAAASGAAHLPGMVAAFTTVHDENVRQKVEIFRNV